MRRNGAYDHEKLGLKKVWCDSQYIITDTAGTSPDLACDFTNKMSYELNQASRPPD